MQASHDELNDLQILASVDDKNIRQLVHYNLTKRDIIIIRALLKAKGKVSNVTLSRQLGIPITTIYRRRKYIEERLMDLSTNLNLAEFGWRKITFDVTVNNGTTQRVMKGIETIPNIIKISRGYGSKGTDVRLIGVVKDNSHIISLCDTIEAIDGVSEVHWFEIVTEYETNDILGLVVPESRNITESDLHDIEE